MSGATSYSLLDRLQHNSESADWEMFAELYTPMILRWARGLGVSEDEASEITNNVMVKVMETKLTTFRRNPKTKFRSFLHRIVANEKRDFFRKKSRQNSKDGADIQDYEPSVPGHVEFIAKKEYNEQLLATALRIMKSRFEETTWKACWHRVVDEWPTERVAEQLGITKGNVYTHTSRVLARLRQELEGLLDD